MVRASHDSNLIFGINNDFDLAVLWWNACQPGKKALLHFEKTTFNDIWNSLYKMWLVLSTGSQFFKRLQEGIKSNDTGNIELATQFGIRIDIVVQLTLSIISSDIITLCFSLH